MKIFAEHDSRLVVLEKKVGLFIFVGIGSLLLLLAVIAVEQGLFASTTKLRFHTDDASKLHEGMEIKLSGFKVGKLTAIVLKDDGVIEAGFVIENEYLRHIRHGATLRLVEQGLLGDSVLEVVPGERGQPLLVVGELLPFERQLGMDALAQDLVGRIKPILDNLKTTTAELNQPNGLLHRAQTLAVQMEKTSVTATELMQQTQEALATNNLKLNHALDKADALLSKSDGVLESVQKVATEAGRLTAASGEDLLPLMRDARSAAEDARDIIEAGKEAWPIRNIIPPSGVRVLPMDSAGGTHESLK